MQLFSWKNMPVEELSKTIGRQMISGERAMMARVYLKKGAVVPEHKHESEQLTFVLEGALELQLEGKKVVVHSGEVLLIPSWVPHSAVALEDTDDLDVFSPIRQDWLSGNDQYLRG